MKSMTIRPRRLQVSGGCQSPDAFDPSAKNQGTDIPRSPIRFLRYASLMIGIIALVHAVAIAQETHDPFATSLDTLKTQLGAAEQRVDHAANAVRQAKLEEMPDQKQLDTLNSQLKIEVRKAFELTQQLQNAQLDDAEAHIAASRKRLETRQRLADSVVARRIEELLTVSPDAVSPQAVIAAMERYGREKDFKALVGLLTDEEADRFAGILIQTVSMTTTMMALAQQSDGAAAADMGPIPAMQETLVKFMKPNPPQDATVALEQLSAIIMSKLFSQMGAITDSRSFVSEMLASVSSFSDSNEPESTAEISQWTFEITGDTAVARRPQPTLKNNVINSPEIKLQLVRGEWKISQFASDYDLLKFSEGPSATVNSAAPTESMQSEPYGFPQSNAAPYQAGSNDSAQLLPLTRPANEHGEPLYQSVTRSEWQSRFANETEPATRIEAAQALVSLAARDNAEERFERCMKLGAELMESGFGESATRFVFTQTAPAYGRHGAGQEYCLWVYQPLDVLFAKWFALLNQTDAVLATIPPRQLADFLIKETNHDSLPRAAFAARLLEQNRIENELKKDNDVRRLIVSDLNRSDDAPLRYALLRTQARFYDPTKDGDDGAGKSFLNSFRKAGEELAAKPVTDYDTFYLAGSWMDLQKRHAFATPDVAARVVLQMLVFDERSTRSVVLLHESDRSQSGGFFPGGLPAAVGIGESFRSEWIAAVNEYLKTQIETDPTKISPAVIGTINEFIRTQTPNEKWDTEETARLLTPLLEKYFVPGAEVVENPSTPSDGRMTSHYLLSTILHCGGEIPRSVIDSDSADSPFQLLKSAIESANVQGDVTQFALPGELDILMFLAIADQLTGVSEEQDRKIAVFLTSNATFAPDDFLRTGSPLQRLQKEIAAAPAQKFLQRIEQKTKTDELRDSVRKLLPQNESASPTEN